jgi:hypothetical protein
MNPWGVRVRSDLNGWTYEHLQISDALKMALMPSDSKQDGDKDPSRQHSQLTAKVVMHSEMGMINVLAS